MSILTRGTTIVTVYPTVPVDDGYGGTQPGEGAPVMVRASVFPSTTEEQSANGYLTVSHYSVIARDLPAGPWSRVDWDGERWTVVADPKRYHVSDRMSYDQATIRR